MGTTIRYLILFLLLNCLIDGVGRTESSSFFSHAVNSQMKADLGQFLKNFPQNKGQQQHLEEVLQNPEYRQILLFIDSPFSFANIQKASQLKKPFSLIGILDALSYNLKLNDSFSDWYLSRFFLLVKREPTLYMGPFLTFCQKSDGSYAEWFADPLLEIIENFPKEFLMGIQKMENRKILCSILKTGDYKSIINKLRSLASPNQTRDNEYINNLLNCLTMGSSLLLTN